MKRFILSILAALSAVSAADEITGLNLRTTAGSQAVNPTAVAGAVLSLDANKRPTFGGNMKIETIAGAGNFSSVVPQWTFGTDYAFRKTSGYGFALTNAAGSAAAPLFLSDVNAKNSAGIGSYLYVSDSVYLVDDAFSNPGIHVSSASTIDFSSGAATHTKGDTIISRDSAATLQLGEDAAGATTQTIKAADRITSDGVGSNLVIQGGNGRGAAGGSLIFKISPAAGAGVTGTPTTALTIDSTRIATFSGPIYAQGGSGTAEAGTSSVNSTYAVYAGEGFQVGNGKGVHFSNGTNYARFIKFGAGSPEGVITGDVGSLWMRTDGGAGTTLYVKESGTGNTGWVAK